MKKTLIFFFLSLLLSLNSCSRIAGIFNPESGKTKPALSTPYLQAVTAKSIYVLVESFSKDTVTVEYGPDKNYGFTARTETIEETSSSFVHNVKLSGLLPNTTYHYRAIVKQDTSKEADFKTAPEAGESFRFAWLADTRTNTNVHAEIAALIMKAKPAFSLYGGDLSGKKEYESWKSEFFIPEESALIASVPFFNAPGNHEGWVQNSKAFTQSPLSASGLQDYYSFDYGDLHVLVINNEMPYSKGTAQFNFAKEDLAKTNRTWKIVASHRPAYCSGGHGEDGDMKTLTTEVFEPYGVSMVLSGHTHFFQHNLVNGIHHLIIGSAGAPLYKPTNAPYTIVSAEDYNFAIFDLSPDRLKMMVYNNKGAALDSLTLNKPAAVYHPTGGK